MSATASATNAPPSFPSYDASAPKALELSECVKRIQEVIKKTLPELCDELCKCPVTLSEMVTPTALRCGHVFEASVISDLIPPEGRVKTCPMCKQTASKLPFIGLIRDFIEKLKEKDPICSFASFQEENELFASRHLELANEYMQLGQEQKTLEKNANDQGFYEEAITHKKKVEWHYGNALKSYEQAFIHTKKSEHYKNIPIIYKQQRQKDKEALACLYLSLYQIEEGKFTEASQSLKQCKTTGLSSWELDSVLVSLAVMGNAPMEVIEESIKGTSASLSETISAHKQILARDPHNFAAFKMLCRLTTDPQERKFLLSKALEEWNLREEAPTLMEKIDWKNPIPFIASLPNKPPALLEFLSSPCPIYGHEGKIALDTHIVFPAINLFKASPRLKDFSYFDREAGGVGCKYPPNSIGNQRLGIFSNEGFEWIVMLKGPIEETMGRPFEEQMGIVAAKRYEVPTLSEAIYASLWGKRCHGPTAMGTPWSFTRVLRGSLIIGCFLSDNRALSVELDSPGLASTIGMAGIRRFKG